MRACVGEVPAQQCSSTAVQGSVRTSGQIAQAQLQLEVQPKVTSQAFFLIPSSPKCSLTVHLMETGSSEEAASRHPARPGWGPGHFSSLARNWPCGPERVSCCLMCKVRECWGEGSRMPAQPGCGVGAWRRSRAAPPEASPLLVGWGFWEAEWTALAVGERMVCRRRVDTARQAEVPLQCRQEGTVMAAAGRGAHLIYVGEGEGEGLHVASDLEMVPSAVGDSIEGWLWGTRPAFGGGTCLGPGLHWARPSVKPGPFPSSLSPLHLRLVLPFPAALALLCPVCGVGGV